MSKQVPQNDQAQALGNRPHQPHEPSPQAQDQGQGRTEEHALTQRHTSASASAPASAPRDGRFTPDFLKTQAQKTAKEREKLQQSAELVSKNKQALQSQQLKQFTKENNDKKEKNIKTVNDFLDKLKIDLLKQCETNINTNIDLLKTEYAQNPSNKFPQSTYDNLKAINVTLEHFEKTLQQIETDDELKIRSEIVTYGGRRSRRKINRRRRRNITRILKLKI